MNFEQNIYARLLPTAGPQKSNASELSKPKVPRLTVKSEVWRTGRKI